MQNIQLVLVCPKILMQFLRLVYIDRFQSKQNGFALNQYRIIRSVQMNHTMNLLSEEALKYIRIFNTQYETICINS